MKILLINKFLHHVGGTETVFFQEWEQLEAAGHEVIPFGMAHPDNIEHEYAEFCVPQVDFAHPSLGDVWHMVWSRVAAERLAKLIEVAKPDVAHLHNIYHQLSPSIIEVLNEVRMPAFLTLHDYKLICPNYKLFTEGAPCTRCVAGSPWQAIQHKCLKNSRVASGLVALETHYHRKWASYAGISQFITPSQFLRQKMIDGGFSSEKITLLPHAIDPPHHKPPIEGDHMLFVGRLTPEKGLPVLLAAARQLRDIPFVVVGDGDMRAELVGKMPPNVHWVGKMARADVWEKCRQARALIMPSIWYEPFGMSALEAMAMGTPVIASKIGGLPEIIQHDKTGTLVPANNMPELATAIDKLWHRPDFAQQLGKNAQTYVQKNHAPDQHLATLLKIFSQ